MLLLTTGRDLAARVARHVGNDVLPSPGVTGPVPETPRLVEIDPDDVVMLALGELRTHVRIMTGRDAPATREVAELLERVVRWAQTGVGMSEAKAADAIATYESILYGSPMRPAPDLIALDLDLEHPVSLVLVAARARLEILRGGELLTREVGVLASVTARRMRQLVAGGELPAKEGIRPGGVEYRVSAANARRFLSARGVGGF